MNSFDEEPKLGIRHQIKAHRLAILGSLYVLFHIWISYEYIRSTINFQAGEVGDITDMSGAVLWILGGPFSVVVGILYARGINENSKAAKFLIILPVVLYLTSLVLYWISQKSYYRDLGGYFTVHLFVGGVSALYFSMPHERKVN